MRCTQDYGLTAEAHSWLSANCKSEPVVVCESCGHSTGGDLVKTMYKDASDVGMFDDGPQLYEYEHKNGGKVREVIQAVPWSSGPCIFICLEFEGKKICKWPPSTINHA